MKHQRSTRTAAAALVLPMMALLCSAPADAQGVLERIKVHGAALQGNLAGDDPDREVFVYLPSGYAQSKRRYPVIYLLHGYNVKADAFARTLGLPAAADAAMRASTNPAIIVLPDAFNAYGGSMYVSSVTIGDWESFIAKDLVGYVDQHYRTLARRESRGLAGHSLGEYGALSIGMKFPHVFGALYAMSACCLVNEAPSEEAVEAQIAGSKAEAGGAKGPAAGFGRTLQAQAASFAANPQNPPQFFDWPFKDGVAQPLVQAKWLANSPAITVDQYVGGLRSYKAIAFDVGSKDPIGGTNYDMDAALTRLAIPHRFAVYEGDHTSRVPERFGQIVIPFFADVLGAR